MEARKVVVRFLRRGTGKVQRNKSIVLKISRFLKKSISIAKTSTITKFPRRRKLGNDYYSNRFLEEYKLSPSRTPLKSGSLIFFCGCLGRMKKGGMVEKSADFEDEGFAGTMSLLDGEDWVDQRAEWFIAKFYQEMRMERQDSGSLIQ